MVVDAGDQLARAAIRQRDTADDVELPQVHRLLPLPTPIRTLVLLGLGIDQSIADQNPVHGRPRRRRIDTTVAQLVADPPSTPPRMLPPQLTRQRLDVGGDPFRARPRPPRPIR